VSLKRAGSERFSLARWSRRKLESALQSGPASADPAASAPAASSAAAPVPSSPSAEPAELPAVESLTFDSDFTPFLRAEVDPDLRRAALKRLLRDPRFNVMDGLDVYIDDYTKADPIPPDMLSELIERFNFRDPEASAPATTATDSTAEAPAHPSEAVPVAAAADGDATPGPGVSGDVDEPLADRKSTRLNSSH